MYVNLATDGSPAIALGTEPSEPDIMNKPPRDPRQSIFSDTLGLMLGTSILLAIISFTLFWIILLNSGDGWPPTDTAIISKARTMIFGMIVFFELFLAYSIRSLYSSLMKIGLLKNKFLLIALVAEAIVVFAIMNIPVLQNVFSLVMLELNDWILLLGLSVLGLVYSEVFKFIKRMRRVNTRNIQ